MRVTHNDKFECRVDRVHSTGACLYASLIYLAQVIERLRSQRVSAVTLKELI
jgi:hypothetical protein